MKNILVVGAGGQIGSEWCCISKIYGTNNVAAISTQFVPITFRMVRLRCRVLDAQKFAELVWKYRVDTIFNSRVLSATGEKNPQLAWKINMGALMNSLEIARENHCAVFTPSSIGAFGPTSPKDNTPQDTVMRPTTVYGICKVTGEMLSDYYFLKYGVDTRSVRFPGIISNVTLPGGGTTDYAVEIYYGAIQQKHYVCPLPQGTYLDMMYMPDALDACVQLMEADPSKLKHRNSFNVTAMSFEPSQIYATIKKRIPDFAMEYNIDPVKKAIADSWPNYMDDSCAREEWGWNPKWNLETMTDDMLKVIGEKYKAGLLK